jgi:hypothetical protein
MYGDLEERIGTQACAVLLVLGSLTAVGKLIAMWRLGGFNWLKVATLMLILYPAVMGWLGFAYILKWEARAALWTASALLKAATSLLSLYYIKQILGRDPTSNLYTENRLLTILVTIESAPACILTRWRLGSIGDAKQFLLLQSLAVYQYSIVLVLSAAANLVLEFATGSDILKYASFSWDCGWVYLVLCVGVSGLVAAYGMLTLGQVFARAKGLSHVASFSLYFSFLTVATTIQEFIITAYAQDSGQQSAYMHGFLLSLEMSACAFSQLFLLTPPLSPLLPTRPLTILSLISHSDFSQVELSQGAGGK